MKTLIAQSAGELPGDHAGQARLGDGRCGQFGRRKRRTLPQNGQRRDFIAVGLIQPHAGKPQARNGDD
jgi:hypothetical protein